MKKIGFITPWYGESIGGGAEAELRGLVHHLVEAGMELEVLTTCVKSFTSDWNENYHPEGATLEAGIPVRRFRVRTRDVGAFDQVNRKLILGEQLSVEEEETFCREMVNSPDLIRYIREHGEEYGLFVCIPYMFGPVYYGVQVYPEKTIMIPCFHDESYAHFACFREAFSRVRGMVFNSEPERKLAEKLYGVKGENFVTFGLGMDTGWSGDAARFRRKYGIYEPFILYAGRKDAGKRVDTLIGYFDEFRKREDSDLKLVLIGGGSMRLPDQENILDLGFVDPQDKYDAYAAAALFCNPSEMESFSIVIMESWLAGRPVLVNGLCPVTKDFVQRTNGGLYYTNYAEFDLCVRYLLSHPQEMNAMAENGRKFVLENFTWKEIVRKYQEYFRRLAEEA